MNSIGASPFGCRGAADGLHLETDPAARGIRDIEAAGSTSGQISRDLKPQSFNTTQSSLHDEVMRQDIQAAFGRSEAPMATAGSAGPGACGLPRDVADHPQLTGQEVHRSECQKVEQSAKGK